MGKDCLNLLELILYVRKVDEKEAKQNMGEGKDSFSKEPLRLPKYVPQ